MWQGNERKAASRALAMCWEKEKGLCGVRGTTTEVPRCLEESIPALPAFWAMSKCSCSQ